MGFPWKGLIVGIREGIAIGGKFDKRLKKLDDAIDHIEETMPDAPGEHKLEAAEVITDAAFESGLLHLTVEEQAEAKALRREYIELGVTARNTAARTVEVSKRLIAMLKD